LAITFAATDVAAINEGGGGSLAVFDSALTLTATKIIVLISTIGQLFCGGACLTSASRMCFAFSRDRGLPGSAWLSKVNDKGVPRNSVITMAIAALLITIPALEGDGAFPYAFFAVVSITVIGLYIAYAIPIFLRWRMGDEFEAGPWNNGKKYKWMNLFSTVWVGFITIIFCLPFTPAAVPWNDEFSWKAFNYAPLTVGAVLIVVGIWWKASAHKYFTGAQRTIDIDKAAPGIAGGGAPPPTHLDT
jgi:amino acid transporter